MAFAEICYGGGRKPKIRLLQFVTPFTKRMPAATKKGATYKDSLKKTITIFLFIFDIIILSLFLFS